VRKHLNTRLSLVIITMVLALGVPIGVVLASHTFSDVPTSHSFHADIEAIAAAGVTGGCAANRYCPEATVTRGQMAAFLNRLGALSPQKPPVVNADRLDGKHADGLIRVAAMRTTSTSASLPAAPTYAFYGTALSIDAPSAGFVVVNGTVTLLNSVGTPCTANCDVAAWLGHSGGANTYGYTETTINPVAGARGAIGFSVLVPVDAGVNYFDIRLARFNGLSGSLHGWYGSLSAVFSPFGPTGTSVTSLAPLTLEEVTKDAP
jgi:hypothetical protein